MRWQADDHTVIGTMLAKKMSARQIAEHFDVTRNSVIGVVHRSKALSAIGFAHKFGGWRKATLTPRTIRPKRVAVPKPELIEVIPPRFITLMELKRGECKWPVNDAARGELHLFCGTPAEPDKPYCCTHAPLGLGKGTPSERSASRDLLRRPLDQRQG
jgi:hypothetical protein